MTSFPDTPLAVQIAEMIARSDRKGAYIDSAGRADALASITFRQYMETCLYDSQYGYYRSGKAKVGKEGDFYTSSAVGSIMGEMIASYAHQYGQSTGGALSIAEWGAGTGRLSAHVAAACHRLDPKPWFRQLLIENLPSHAEEAARALRGISHTEPPVIISSEQLYSGYVGWMSERPLLLIANELLDAFPVHRVTMHKRKLMELGVAVKPGQGFFYTLMPLTEPKLEDWLSRDGIMLREGQITEVCPGARDWVMQLGALCERGRVMIIDYGHDAAEYAAEHRMKGTLMTYANHQASDSPFNRPGERDITAHVSFDFIRSCADEAGFDVVYFATQKQFLVDQGVFGLLGSHDGADPFGESARRNRAIRQLLLSDGMSESFKVMLLEKRLPL
ncbi:class I SAM-dependent methyltransferase [Paenibacillus soyae]|uniref:SAM-dependent methyltransferase n=1 Tax=Paenibacillus soyae TaxID=2969249 RepID=A0A9X2MNV5_9BACL|nr:SAM-dependent methyltransferase [Paenibacillus soyae]MCR2803715.1 SAM-dependent methyltransferase [Paenibacillus soyae]